jgi:hypothetical protein
MEPDDLKSTWMSLDERLKKQEVLKENIMKELLHTKSDKALNKLIGYEVLGVIVLFLIMPVIVYCLSRRVDLPEYTVFMYCMLAVCIIGIIWMTVKVYYLTRIDFSKTLSNNILYMNKYNIKIRREKMVMAFFVPLLGLAAIYLYVRLNANALLWVFMSCVFVCAALYSYWSYKKLYDRNIASILKSLDELKELGE